MVKDLWVLYKRLQKMREMYIYKKKYGFYIYIY